MSDYICNDSMLDVFIFESDKQLEQLEQCVLRTEKKSEYEDNTINEIFRILHTIKGSSAVMLFNNISNVAHAAEDLFYFIRESKPKHIEHLSLNDIVLESLDFIKLELYKIKNGDKPDGVETNLIQNIKSYLQMMKEGIEGAIPPNTNAQIKRDETLDLVVQTSNDVKGKNYFKINIHFQDGCEMENIRAFAVVHELKDNCNELYHIPEDIIEDTISCKKIRTDGFVMFLNTNQTYENLNDFLNHVGYAEKIDILSFQSENEYIKEKLKESPIKEITISQKTELPTTKDLTPKEANTHSALGCNSMISVNVLKLDKLMDLMGELVIAEAMVTQNPDIQGIPLDNFEKSARQLKKITSELQDTVMSIRMVPLGPTFFKMNRIVRDMSRKLNKEVNLQILGQDTEVDKNIIEHIGDPLMHLIRNSLDHGIESSEERLLANKPPTGNISIEAKNTGSEVLIIIKDDGKGLNKDAILYKAMSNQLLYKEPEDMDEKEIFQLIFLPGFSTKENVTEFSGRGVGMDVVVKNLESIGGSISVSSVQGVGTTFTLKIPLTLAIVDGMNVRVGKSRFTFPINCIKESFRPKENDIFSDTDNNQMIIIRGICYPIIQLHRRFNIKTDITDFHEGILIMVESDTKTFCIFVDELIGQQQVVVKGLPEYISNIKKINGIAGCTLLGDGGISLILDIDGLLINDK